MFGFGKRKKDEVPEVDNELFLDLRRAVREDLKARLSSGEIPGPEQGLYCLACFLLFDWDSSLVGLYSITEKEYRSLVQSKPKEKAQIYRWCMVEYGTEFICDEELKAIWKAYDVRSLDDDTQWLAIDEFEGRTQFALIQALKDLERTGVLGEPEFRDKLTLLSGETDNEEIPDDGSLILSVRALNSKPIANQFIGDWMKLRGFEGTAADWSRDILVKASETTFGRLLSQKK
jgi:hypothetical protein